MTEEIELTEGISTQAIFYLEKIEIMRKKKKGRNKFHKIINCQAMFDYPQQNASKTIILEQNEEKYILVPFNEKISLSMKNNDKKVVVKVIVGKGSNGDLKELGTFNLEISDIPDTIPDETIRIPIKSDSEAASKVDLIYKVYKKPSTHSSVLNSIPTNLEPQRNQPRAEVNQLHLKKNESQYNGNSSQSEENIKQWKKNSFVLVVGSVKCGKTTTMNLYTGNSVSTGDDERVNAETSYITIYPDTIHESQSKGCFGTTSKNYPNWIDIPGFDEWRQNEHTRNDDEELERTILKKLYRKNEKASWIEAIIWNIKPLDVKTPQLVKEANFIHDKLGKKSKNVWKKVIVVVNMSMSMATKDDRNVLGAKHAIMEVTGGDGTIVKHINFLQYRLERESNISTVQSNVPKFTEESKKKAIQELDKAFYEIKEPLEMVFTTKICEDCGVVGDQRLLAPFCHDRRDNVPNICSCLPIPIQFPERIQCSKCKGKWSNRFCGFGFWTATDGDPKKCVVICRDAKQGTGETAATKIPPEHRMVEKKWWMCGSTESVWN